MPQNVKSASSAAHWGCTRVSGGWGKPSLQEFDYNPFTKDQFYQDK